MICTSQPLGRLGSSGAPSRRSRASLGDRSRLRLQRNVTWRDRRAELTVGFRSIAGTRGGPGSGPSPAGEVPDDHCRPIRCARHDPARLHPYLPFALGRPHISPRGLCRPLPGLLAAAFRACGIALRSTAIHAGFTGDPRGRPGSGGHSLHAWQQSRRPQRWRGQRPGPCGMSPGRTWPPPRSRCCASWCSEPRRISPSQTITLIVPRSWR
jgi:hypothetical protein